MDDDALLTASRRDPEAFGAFYRRHERAVFAYFRRRVPTPELAADLTAETFAAAQLAALELIHGASRVDELLERLPGDQAAAVRARIIDDDPYDVIAARMQCSEQVVRKR